MSSLSWYQADTGTHHPAGTVSAEDKNIFCYNNAAVFDSIYIFVIIFLTQYYHVNIFMECKIRFILKHCLNTESIHVDV